jgi:hypothetical protein
MSETVRYGIFGEGEVVIDDDGFIDMPVIVQESGLFEGSPPDALRIHTMGVFGDDEFNKQYTAKLNEKADLPFYLTTAKIKIVAPMVKHTTKSIEAEGIEPLDDIEWYLPS